MTESNAAPVPPPPSTNPEPNRRLMVVVVGIVIAIGLVVGGVLISRGDDKPEASGPPPAPCGTVITKVTDQTQDHVDDENVRYVDAPPSFGAHFPQWEQFGRTFYTDDRPPVSHLVHNLEHGYTIVWYDETAAKNDATMTKLRDVAAKYLDQAERLLVVPWRPSDGNAFPTNMHVALTRWTADPADPADMTKQRGNWLYCGGAERDKIDAFFDQFPNAASPEPGIPIQ